MFVQITYKLGSCVGTYIFSISSVKRTVFKNSGIHPKQSMKVQGDLLSLKLGEKQSPVKYPLVIRNLSLNIRGRGNVLVDSKNFSARRDIRIFFGRNLRVGEME